MESRASGTKTSPINSRTWKKNFIFIVIFAILIAFRIWLTFGIPKCYFYAPHDDLFFAKAANDLLNGQWLGKFDNITLIKVPFYAFFLAFSSLTHLPLLFNETIFYIGACLLLDRSVQPLIKNRWWRLLLFTILLYCPASLITGWTVRVYREYVYFSLTLMVIAFAIGLLLRVNTTLKAMIGWGIGFGISLSAFLLTREEGAWIIPALFYFFICCFWIIWKKGSAQKWQQSIALFIPIFLAYLPILVVSSVNYSYYGLWGTSDQLDPDFNRVINTLGRIKTGSTWYPYVRVSHESLDKAYAASPMMA